MDKPSVYLDQNILDCLLKEASDQLMDYLSQNWIICYSPTTLSEIHKAGSNSNNSRYLHDFLDLLDKLSAKFLTNTLELDGTRQHFMRWNVNSYEAYIKYIEDILPFENMLINTLKIGMVNYSQIDTPSKQVEGQINELFLLLKYIGNCQDILRMGLEKEIYSKHEKALFGKFVSDSEKHLEELLKQVPVVKSGLERFYQELYLMGAEKGISQQLRKECQINHDNLNKIEGKNTFERIIDYIQSLSDINGDLLQVFLNNINDESRQIFERIMLAYDFLNLIGYKVDKSLHKENKFLSAQKDSEHVGFASLCDWFISNDQRLIHKTKVIYEYFGINTNIFSLGDLNDHSFKLKIIN